MSHENNIFAPQQDSQQKSMVSVESDKEIAQVQAAMVIAKKFPRDQRQSMDNILNACSRKTLAEVSQYQYSKGGSDISGPSIRLAEALAQNWGNFQHGIKEISQSNGESTVQAYAWDLETNTKSELTFQVPHIRHTKKGQYPITDPREIYELIANQGARRKRACILALIPGDVQDAAVNQCNVTLTASCDTSPEAVQKWINAFSSLGVSKAAIEKNIQRRIDTITAAQIVRLRNIYNSIKDGMSSPNDWFESGILDGDGSSLDDALKAIDEASSREQIDGVLSIIDTLSAKDQSIARKKWMEKLDLLKKQKKGDKNQDNIKQAQAATVLPLDQQLKDCKTEADLNAHKG